MNIATSNVEGDIRIIVAKTHRPTTGYYLYIKHSMDVILAATMLVLLSPVLLLIALLIKLDSPGPVFFIQGRVGSRRRTVDGHEYWEIRPFRMYKFRSMVNNADPKIHEQYIKAFVEGSAASSNTSGARFKLNNDPRVTRVGNVLRVTSLDELPQLLNVLRGEMSLVGPRPVPLYEVDLYQPWHTERLAALPGITGAWQVSGRGEVTFEEMVRMDIDYVRNCSLRRDLSILLRTIPAVVSRRGAA